MAPGAEVWKLFPLPFTLFPYLQYFILNLNPMFTTLVPLWAVSVFLPLSSAITLDSTDTPVSL